MMRIHTSTDNGSHLAAEIALSPAAVLALLGEEESTGLAQGPAGVVGLPQGRQGLAAKPRAV
eukprot:scaffold74225_cov40-Prasinocladus_malaysianus.AAC.1